jgi:sn-glycerol 3-phosphate transport system permease protein
VTPITLTIIVTLISAALVGALHARNRRNLSIGLALGALAGLLSTQLSMIPLQYCVLDPENHMFFEVSFFGQTTTVNAVTLIGGLAIAIVTWGVMLGLTVMLQEWRTKRRLLPPAETTPGMFARDRISPWLFIAPTVIGVALFTYWPAVQNFILGTQLARRGIPTTRFICIDNFAALITGRLQDAHYYFFSDDVIFRAENAAYLDVLAVSFFFSFFIVILANIIGLGIAMLAFQKIRGAAAYRTLLIWPYALSGVVVGIVFRIMLGNAGVINHFIQGLGLPEIPFLLDQSLARWSVILAATWNILAFNILIYVAALQAVPKELLEAASIDGANVWHRFLNVTLPMISPYTYFVVFINLNYTFFDLFGLIDNLTQGGPVNATTNMVVDIIQTGVVDRDIGKAAAVSIVLLFIVIGLAFLQYRLMGRRVTYGAT